MWFLLSAHCRHEVAEAAGVISQSFGVDEVDRHNILFKKVLAELYYYTLFHLITIKYVMKEYPPSEEELRALRNGEVCFSFKLMQYIPYVSQHFPCVHGCL